MEGEPFQIGAETFTRGSVEAFHQPIDGTEASDNVPALIAFRLLAFVLGANIFDSRLNDLRDAIRSGRPASEWHVAERGIDRVGGYQPWHLVGVSQADPHVVVRVQLFGWSVWRVHFPRIVGENGLSGWRFDVERHRLAYAEPRPTATPLLPPSAAS